jgi:hypothetical protein
MKIGDKVEKISDRHDQAYANKRNDPAFRKGCILTIKRIVRLPSGNQYLEFEENDHSSPLEDFKAVT